MKVRITTEGAPQFMNILGKLPESPSARFTLNGVDVLKVIRDWLEMIATMTITAALLWVEQNSNAKIEIGGHDYTMVASILIPLVVKPALASARRLLTNGVKPPEQDQPQQ